MDSIHQLSEHEFASRLTPETLRVFQIIHAGLMGSATMFLLLIVMLQVLGGPGGMTGTEVVDILSIMHALVALSAFSASRIIFERMFNAGSILNAADPYSAAIAMMRSALLIRMAVMEAAAMFGLVVCIIAVTGGITQTEPVYLLNAASYALFILIGFMTFPTVDSLSSIFRTRILQQ